MKKQKVADAIKADGWKFASHTWGHIRIGDASLESIQKDTEKWLSYVAPLVGGTDTIIFAHGQDLADWHDYSSDNEKFTYLKSQGFNFFCNVDSSQYFLQIRDNYVRQEDETWMVTVCGTMSTERKIEPVICLMRHRFWIRHVRICRHYKRIQG